jgi:hypothetical protein
MGVSKFPKLGLSRLCRAITLCVNLWLRWSLKQIAMNLYPTFDHYMCFRCLNGSCEPILDMYYRNPSLRFTTKARVYKSAGQEKDPWMWESVNTHTPKWTPMLGIGVLVESWIFRERLQGSKPISLNGFYTIRKILKRRCLKWARMTHLDIWNTTYSQKKGPESNWQFDFRPQKVGNRPNSLACMWCATLRWKALHKGYNFASDLILIGGL